MALVLEKSKLVTKIFIGVFWLVAVIPFLGQELMPGVYEKISTLLYAFVDFVIISLGLWVIKDKKDWAILIAFVALSFISTYVVNGYSILFYINGLRMYLCYILCVPIYRYFFDDLKKRNMFTQKMDRVLYIFLWLQLPVALVQFFLYGAYDNVGGTMGWMMSGEMSTLVYLISFYFMHKNWDKAKSYIVNIKENWVLILLLLPSFLNETKISFVYLMMYFFFLLPIDRKFIKRMLIFIPCMVVVFFIAGYFYLTVTGAGDDVLTEEYFTMYFTGDDDALTYMEFAVDNGVEEIGDDQGDIFRGVKFAAIPFIQMRESHAPYIGFGIGQFKGGTVFDKSEFANEFEWLFKGAVMGFYMVIIELGYAGLLFILLFWIITFKTISKRSNKGLLLYQIFTVIILGIYNNAFITTAFYIIFFYIVFVNNNWKIIRNYE